MEDLLSLLQRNPIVTALSPLRCPNHRTNCYVEADTKHYQNKLPVDRFYGSQNSEGDSDRIR